MVGGALPPQAPCRITTDIRAVWITENTYLSGVFEERKAIGSPFCACQIIITAVQVYKLVWQGSNAIHACMRRRADNKLLNSYFCYKFKIVNNKEKPSTTGKLNQWWKTRRLSTCNELHCTALKRDTNKKIKKISIEIKRM